MPDITDQLAKFGDSDNTLLIKAAKALQAASATLGSAVLYTAQTLSQAQASQAATNIFGVSAGVTSAINLDATGDLPLISWKKSGVIFAQIFPQAASNKWCLLGDNVSIATGSNGVLQLGYSGENNDSILFQYNALATNGAQAKHGKLVNFAANAWISAASATRYHQLRAYADPTTGTELRVYSDATSSVTAGTDTGVAFRPFGMSFPATNSATATSLRSVSSTGNSGLNFVADRGVSLVADGVKCLHIDAAAVQMYIKSFQGDSLVMDILNRQLNSANSGARLSWDNSNVTVASGTGLVLGNAAVTGLTPGALSALTDASIVIKDSTGTSYRIPCITP